MTPILQFVAVGLLTLGAGASAVSVMQSDMPDFAVPTGAWEAGSLLDDRAFSVTGRVVESGEALPETILTFAEGRFQSSRCQVYCAFGWQAYQTWREGDITHFTATTRCPDAPHTVVWYGTVTGDEMQVAGTWTTRRWYWSRQITLDGTGTPADPASMATRG
ncbi:hypothetical protein ACFQ3C_04195 [Seohaeicola saemankumensis]|uniref:Uncharacterized protein n=1 Tax=Seohaeicola saemankumensis TaxID=481181 RepID=A0ABW3T9X5_9RHOB